MMLPPMPLPLADTPLMMSRRAAISLILRYGCHADACCRRFALMMRRCRSSDAADAALLRRKSAAMLCAALLLPIFIAVAGAFDFRRYYTPLHICRYIR